MARAITLSDLPDGLLEKLALRAECSGQSLEEYLRVALIEHVRRDRNADVLAVARERVEHTGTRLSADRILQYRNECRR